MTCEFYLQKNTYISKLCNVMSNFSYTSLSCIVAPEMGIKACSLCCPIIIIFLCIIHTILTISVANFSLVPCVLTMRSHHKFRITKSFDFSGSQEEIQYIYRVTLQIHNSYTTYYFTFQNLLQVRIYTHVAT